MYSKEVIYKIETQTGIIYTAKVVDEDAVSIKIRTIRNEELILNKGFIQRSKTEENCTDGTYNK